MNYTINLVIKIVIATAAAILFGNGSVVAFNNIPQKWFEDWELDEECTNGTGGTERRIIPPAILAADNAGRQRLASTPWKYAFMGMFLVTGVYLAVTNTLQYEVASLCVLFAVLEMAIADQVCKTVPDQLQLLLAITALGFITTNENWWEPLAGAGIGFAVGISVLGLGYLIFRNRTFGGADIKFFTCIGLVLGRQGALVIFLLTNCFYAVLSVYKIARGNGSWKDSEALLPSAFAAVLIYILFLYNVNLAEIYF